MSRIDTHPVTGHSVLNLVDNRTPSGLDTQHLGSFNDMIGCGVFADNALGGHNFLKAVAFDEELLVAFFATSIVLVLDVYDGTANCRDTLDDDLWQGALKFAKTVVLVGTINVDPQAVLPRNHCDRLVAVSERCSEVQQRIMTYLLLDLELLRRDNRPFDIIQGEFQLTFEG